MLTNHVPSATMVDMETVNVHEAKTHLSRLLERVERGEEIVIARAGKPIAVLSAYVPPESQPRVPGDLGGQGLDVRRLRCTAAGVRGLHVTGLLDTHGLIWWLTNDRAADPARPGAGVQAA